MSSIAIVAINARYTHTALGARFLQANLGDLRHQSLLLEYNINEPPAQVASAIIGARPAIIGIGVYIWNRTFIEALLPVLRGALPDASIILGGPEISHAADSGLARAADCVILGEADTAFATVCRAILNRETVPRLFSESPPDLSALALPYAAYSEHDLSARAVYVETSRGCIHRCEYCLSALDDQARAFDEQAIGEALDDLCRRGVQNLRIVDRSFNLGGARARRILAYIRERLPPGACLHLELTPDELSRALRAELKAFPEGKLHVEVGVQTLAPDVSARVGRPMDCGRVEDGIRFLVEQTSAAVHADLIAGLPGETPDSFIRGFDQLYAWGPDEIQVGLLKKLHGAPIERHVVPFGMLFEAAPPYTILETSTMPREFIRDVIRFAAHWERVINRGHLPRSTAMLLESADSPWRTFDRFSRQLASAHGIHGIALLDTCRCLLSDLVEQAGRDPAEARAALREDYLDDGRRIGVPRFLR